MKRVFKIVPLLTLFLFSIPTILQAGPFRITYVLDGDTVIAKGHEIEIKVRLAAIDAPESPLYRPYTFEARKYLAQMILNKTVDIQGCGLGPVNRVLGVLYLNGRNINLEMVKAGLAFSCPEKAPKGFDLTLYLEAETEAKKARRGMWILEEQGPEERCET